MPESPPLTDEDLQAATVAMEQPSPTKRRTPTTPFDHIVASKGGADSFRIMLAPMAKLGAAYFRECILYLHQTETNMLDCYHAKWPTFYQTPGSQVVHLDRFCQGTDCQQTRSPRWIYIDFELRIPNLTEPQFVTWCDNKRVCEHCRKRGGNGAYRNGYVTVGENSWRPFPDQRTYCRQTWVSC